MTPTRACVRAWPRGTQGPKDEAVSKFSFVSTETYNCESATALTNYCKYEFTREMSTVARDERLRDCVYACMREREKRHPYSESLSSEMRILTLKTARHRASKVRFRKFIRSSFVVYDHESSGIHCNQRRTIRSRINESSAAVL